MTRESSEEERWLRKQPEYNWDYNHLRRRLWTNRGLCSIILATAIFGTIHFNRLRNEAEPTIRNVMNIEQKIIEVKNELGYTNPFSEDLAKKLVILNSERKKESYGKEEIIDKYKESYTRKVEINGFSGLAVLYVLLQNYVIKKIKKSWDP